MCRASYHSRWPDTDWPPVRQRVLPKLAGLSLDGAVTFEHRSDGWPSLRSCPVAPGPNNPNVGSGATRKPFNHPLTHLVPLRSA
jgi:hypothetical protein